MLVFEENARRVEEPAKVGRVRELCQRKTLTGADDLYLLQANTILLQRVPEGKLVCAQDQDDRI